MKRLGGVRYGRSRKWSDLGGAIQILWWIMNHPEFFIILRLRCVRQMAAPFTPGGGLKTDLFYEWNCNVQVTRNRYRQEDCFQY